MHPQRQNNHNNTPLEIAMQQLVEAHTGIMRVMTQNMANREYKELPPGVQQILNDHSRIVLMMSQMVASNHNSLPQEEHGGKRTQVNAEMIQQACKRCGEIGHTSKDCHEEWPHCDPSYPVEECPVTCFLCEGTNHIPAECKFYSTVQRINQQAEIRMSQLSERTPEDGRLKRKMEDKDMEIAPNHTTKCCYSCEEEGHLSRDCSKRREYFPTAVVEYEENEVKDLLAQERPKRKKDNSKITCFKCKELGHYADQCPTRYHEVNMQDSTKRDHSMITCFKCKQKGHYSYNCSENETPRPQ
jgi:cellular nucleic acid-binding protein